LFFFGLVAAALLFWLWMLVECATKEPDTGNTKIVWILVILLGTIVGAPLYFVVRRPQRWREVGR
jgi:prolipoprotein diacylglyceryltransferase